MKNLVLKAKLIKDSRGKTTVEVSLKAHGVEAKGRVPAGTSTGKREAATVAPPQAVDNVHNVILPLLRNSGLDLRKHADLIKAEKLLIAEEFIRRGSDRELGANATVPVSWALWRTAAALSRQELWAYIRANEPDVAGQGRVLFFMNIFNGGLHALKEGERLGKDRIDIQEVMIVPVGAKSYKEALDWGDKIDQTLKKTLTREFGAPAVTRATEAGFSVKGLGDSSRAFRFVHDAIGKAGFKPGQDVKIALDVAASSFFNGKNYDMHGAKLSSAQLRAYLVGLVKKFPGVILSIEDGLSEDDWSGWPKHSAEMDDRDVVTIGDDLFVTQLPPLEKGIILKAAHAILIKVNQNGTLHGTIEVIKQAKKHGLQWVVSHRSGETLDDGIADLAYATGAMGLKTGDPQPKADFPDEATWVRRKKYLRMVEIEESQRSGSRK